MSTEGTGNDVHLQCGNSSSDESTNNDSKSDESTSDDTSKRISRLNEAWEKRNIVDFQSILLEDAGKQQTEEFLQKLIDKTKDNVNDDRKLFWEVIFKSQVHRKTFQNETTLVRCLVQSGNSKVLKLLLKHQPNMRQTSEDGNLSLHHLCTIDWKQDERKTRSYERCMRLLVDHPAIDINALNYNFETPLDLALEKLNEDALKILLKSSKKLYLRKENFDGLSKMKIPLPDEAINTYEDLIVPCKLQAWLKQKMPIFSDELKKAMDNKKTGDLLPEKLHIFLQEACKQNFEDAVKSLLNYGADPSLIDEWNDSRSAIVVATEYGHITLIPMLMDSASLLNFKLEHVREKCDSKNINKPDNKQNTALHYAVNYGHETAMLDILEAGGDIGYHNKRGEIPLTKIPANVLKIFLDGRIKKNTGYANGVDKKKSVEDSKASGQTTPKSGPCRLEFDCEFLKRNDSNRENFISSAILLNKMSGDIEQRKLLSHPVLAAYALKKWDKMIIIFILNFIFYTGLCSFLTFNTLCTSTYVNEFPFSTRIIQGSLLFVLLLRESFQVYIQKGHYFLQYENYLELSILAIGGYLSIAGCADNLTLCRHLGAVVVLFCWFGFLLLIGKHPTCSVYVEMFLLVLSSFLKIILIFVILILAFACSFFVLFNECSDSCPVKDFQDIKLSIFKTLIMITGEFDSTEIPFQNYPVTSHLIFILFVFLIAIVLLNLLNGLAVYDTQKIKEDALLHGYVSRVKYLATLDELLLGLPETFFGKFRKFFTVSNYIIKFDYVDPVEIKAPEGSCADLIRKVISYIRCSSNRGGFDNSESNIIKNIRGLLNRGNFFNLVLKLIKHIRGLSNLDISQNAYKILNEKAKNNKKNDEKKNHDKNFETLCNSVNQLRDQMAFLKKFIKKGGIQRQVTRTPHRNNSSKKGIKRSTYKLLRNRSAESHE